MNGNKIIKIVGLIIITGVVSLGFIIVSNHLADANSENESLTIEKRGHKATILNLRNQLKELKDELKKIPSPEKRLGYIRRLYRWKGKSYLDIDYVKILSGQEALEVDSTLNCAEFFVLNEDYSIDAFEIWQKVEIRMCQYSHTESGNFKSDERISFSTFKDIFTGKSAQKSLRDVPYEIQLQHGVVTHISQQYVP